MKKAMVFFFGLFSEENDQVLMVLDSYDLRLSV